MQDGLAGERPERRIAAFTREDYQGVAPYEWLYGFRDNAFQLERLRGLLVEDARAKKVTNAGLLWRSYVETQMGGQGRDLAQNVTVFSGQPMELKCGDYECFDNGVSIANHMGGVTVVCPHPVMPVKRLVNIDTGEVKTELAFRRGAGWRYIVYDKATLSNARSVTALAACGVSVTSESAKDLVRYLAYLEDANYDELPEVKTVGRLGWVEGYGFSPYVEGLMYDGAGLYGDAFRAVRQGGSYDEWLSVARGVRAGKSVPCRVALAASFASVLVEKAGALPFILHLWGSVSGIGKSVALILAASVWAYPDIGSYVKTTKSTSVGYEQMAAFCGNLPLCLDELQLIQGKKEFDELIYTLCEGVSKTRGARAGGVQQAQRWRNAILTTGEQPITGAGSKAGAVNRVLEVECPDRLFPDPRAAYQTLVRNYGHAGRRFVEALCAHKDAMELTHDMQQDFYNRLAGRATDKQVLTASLILAADAMAELMLFEDGHSLTADDLLPYLVTPTQADTNRRAYDWLCDWVASNPARFTANSFGEYAGECWGRVDGAKAYIIRGVFERVMTAEGYSPAGFLSWADKAGLIDRQGGKRTKVMKIQGVCARCVTLSLPNEDGAKPTEDAGGNTDVTSDSDVSAAFDQMRV